MRAIDGNPAATCMSEYVIAEPVAMRQPSWGTLASIALHGGFGALALFALTPRHLDVPPPRSVTVDLISAATYQTLLAPPVEPEPTAPAERPLPVPETPVARAPASPPPPPTTALPPTSDGMVRATQLYAGAILADPANRKIVATLLTIADSERMVQLCNIEGLEQFRRFDPKSNPDTLVIYAMADPTLAGRTLTALGGAVRSRRQWYRVRLRCTVAANLKSVEAFEFALGEKIPRDQWEAHNLTEQEDEE